MFLALFWVTELRGSILWWVKEDMRKIFCLFRQIDIVTSNWEGWIIKIYDSKMLYFTKSCFMFLNINSILSSFVDSFTKAILNKANEQNE